MKRQALGKNLQSLLSSTLIAPAPQSVMEVSARSALKKIRIEQIIRSPFQPRREFNQEQLEELAQSIRVQGLLQPIVVRRVDENFELIAGERRWRASQLAGLSEIDAIVREVDDQTALALAIIENIQRAELSPMEESHALKRLQQEFQLTHEQIAENIGRSRTAVTNILRLQNLNKEVQLLLQKGELEMGHARALLSLPLEDQLLCAKQIIEKKLSVRETEKLVKVFSLPPVVQQTLTRDPDVEKLMARLSDKLAAKVEIKHTTSGKGNITIFYHSLAELDGILEHIK